MSGPRALTDYDTSPKAPRSSSKTPVTTQNQKPRRSKWTAVSLGSYTSEEHSICRERMASLRHSRTKGVAARINQ
jgi:hypothetical protein